jgi:hypothetical protein
MQPIEIRYRLRRGPKVVGFMRKIGNKNFFFSPDEYWWNGKTIDHDHMDEESGMYDGQGQRLYEMDIVRYSLEGWLDREGVIQWSAARGGFYLLDIEDPSMHIPLKLEGLSLFPMKDLKFKDHLFSQPELMAVLGVRDN